MPRKVSLFVPCFVDQLLPQVAIDTAKVLRRVGWEVDFPAVQTCCGQPAFNSGFWNEARPCAERFLDVFKNADYVVCPSGSCVTMVRVFYPELLGDAGGTLSGAGANKRAALKREEATALGIRTFEFSEFLVKVAAVTDVGAVFPHTVTYHGSCHGLRELHLKEEPLRLLREVKGLKLLEMPHYDECCGFGGTFATKFESISVAMGISKADNIATTAAEFVTAIDPSCLMHIQGIMGKRGDRAKAIHLATLLAEDGKP